MGSGKSVVAQDNDTKEIIHTPVEQNDIVENEQDNVPGENCEVEILIEQNVTFDKNICLNVEDKPKKNKQSVQFLKQHNSNKNVNIKEFQLQPQKCVAYQGQQNLDILELEGEEIDLLESIGGKGLPPMEVFEKQQEPKTQNLREIKINAIIETNKNVPRKLPPLQPSHAMRVLHKEKENSDEFKPSFSNSGNLESNKLIRITPSSSRRIRIRNHDKSLSQNRKSISVEKRESNIDEDIICSNQD